MTLDLKRKAETSLRLKHGLSEHRACRTAKMHRSTYQHKRKKDDGNSVLREHMLDVALERPSFGLRRLGIMHKRYGYVFNRKKLYRLYREEGLAVKRRKGRKRALGTRRPMLVPNALNQRWRLDFVSDTLTDGRRIRVLCVVDDYAREALATILYITISGFRGRRELSELIMV